MHNIIQIEINLMQSFVFFIFITLPWLLISSLYSPVILAQISVQDWEQKQVSQHILVSSSTVNNVYKVNAKMYVHATPDEFFTLLENTQKDCSWIANCKRVEVLNQSLSQYRFVHTVFNSPWPVADREMYTRSFHQFDQSHRHLSILIEDISSDYPTHPKRVMMNNVTAQWSMSYSHDGWYELNYLASAEPGGLIPTWLSKTLLKNATAETFAQLRERLHADKTF